MYLRRDILAQLLSANAELTLAQALDELRLPLGAIDATINVEDWFVIGSRLCHGGASVAAGGAGTRSQVGLECASLTVPLPGLVVLEQLVVSNPDASNRAIILRANFTSVVATNGFVRDARFGTLAGSRSVHGLIVTQNIAAASGTFITNLVRLPAGTSTVPIPYPMVITRFQNIVFDSGADQVPIEATFWWREFDIRQR